MTQMKLFLQFEGHRSIELIQVPEDAAPGDVLAAAAALGAETHEAFLFAGDAEDPLDPHRALRSQGVQDKVRVHLHRCKKVRVTLNFAGEAEKHHNFTPSTTVDQVKRWYVEKLKMSPVDASEHVLQIAGTTDRPDPDVQIGALVHCSCEISLTLVPVKRIEG